MDNNNKDRKPETDMHVAHRRADTILTVITVILAAVLIGLSAYTAIWYAILPLLGVTQCS